MRVTLYPTRKEISIPAIMIRRSRKGYPLLLPQYCEFVSLTRGSCWTCKKRHKKCDEAHPACGRCIQAKITCEGYGTRLTWGPSDLDPTTTGILLNPIRQSRLEQRSIGFGDSNIAPIELNGIVESDQVWSPDSQLDILYLQHSAGSTSSTETEPSDEVSKRLMENCEKTSFRVGSS